MSTFNGGFVYLNSYSNTYSESSFTFQVQSSTYDLSPPSLSINDTTGEVTVTSGSLNAYDDTDTEVTATGPFLLIASDGTNGAVAGATWLLIKDTSNNHIFAVTNSPSPDSANFGNNISFADNTVTTACFLEGTQILTRSGYRPVESLEAGDEVLTLNHGWQAIRWLGYREVEKSLGADFPASALPIRICRDAFGHDLPARDLLVSPDHALFFRDHLIPAKSLVNGKTIVRDASVESIKYFHVLLDRHAVIFSEGLPTESYIPQENLDSFENVSSCPEDLRSGFVAPIGMYADCYPRAIQGAIVETARAYLTRDLIATLDRAAA